MSDYKELIVELQGSVAHMERFGILTASVKREEIKTVADAIEQLVRERDAAVDDMDTIVKTPAPLCVVCNEAHCEACRTSEYNSGFEWRGAE